MQQNSRTLSPTAYRNEEMRHYQQGNAYYQRGDWQQAIEHYLEACELNSESPAREKLNMVYSILDFYNKDIFGQ